MKAEAIPRVRYVFRHQDGRYEKVGGSRTPHLAEAAVLGWNAPLERWHPDRGGRHGELLPVEITLVVPK